MSVYLKRDDLIHPQISGNKWRKLKYNLMLARRQGYDTLLTFGGAYSNHIHAVAAAGRVCGFQTVGVIRGQVVDNPTLRAAQQSNMRLLFVDRETYRRRHTPELLEKLKLRFGRVYVLPEGGSNLAALPGVTEVVTELNAQLSHYDLLVCAAGTGATLAGLVCGLRGQRHVMGISVLRDGSWLANDVRRWLNDSAAGAWDNWHIETDFHHGGYARATPPLQAFISQFTQVTGVPLDHVYTGKMLFALYALIEQGRIARDSTVVALHTGGVQYDAQWQPLHAIDATPLEVPLPTADVVPNPL